jgi:hypothetical protein
MSCGRQKSLRASVALGVAMCEQGTTEQHNPSEQNRYGGIAGQRKVVLVPKSLLVVGYGGEARMVRRYPGCRGLVLAYGSAMCVRHSRRGQPDAGHRQHKPTHAHCHQRARARKASGCRWRSGCGLRTGQSGLFDPLKLFCIRIRPLLFEPARDRTQVGGGLVGSVRSHPFTYTHDSNRF